MVSAFGTRGLCADLFRRVLAEHELLTAEVVLAEMERVLRDKFRLPGHIIENALDVLRRYDVQPRPVRLPPHLPAVRDPDDAWVLASALAGRAEVLVTGDKDLLAIRDAVRELAITDPRGFWAMIG